MSPQEYYTLKRYAMKMSSDVDDQDELVLLAWQESLRLGKRATMPLLVNFMKLRARSCDRSIVGAELGGKSKMDVWDQNPVSLSKPVDKDEKDTLGDFLRSPYFSPFDTTVTNQFVESMDGQLRAVLGDLNAGFTHREILRRQKLTPHEFYRLREVLKEKATEYLV